MSSRPLKSIQESLQKYAAAQATQKHLNAFTTVSQDPLATFVGSSEHHSPTNEETLEDTSIVGDLIAVKDNICTKDLPTTCASNGLRNYQSPFDATVVERIKQHGGIIAGKTNLDEFGMGSHSTNSTFGPVLTPHNISPGGSSGGSAVAVATGQCDSALATDTGGSVRLPAAYTSIHGFKPSYGLISRWGVVAYANSLDTVGFMARNPRKIRALFRATNAHDPRDPTSLPVGTRNRLGESLDRRRGKARKWRIGVPREYVIEGLDSRVREAWRRSLLALHAAGSSVHEISLPTTKSALSAYYVLAPAEASSNLAKYDGVRYGSAAARDRAGAEQGSHVADSRTGVDQEERQLYTKHRDRTLSPEVRRRILLGTYTLSAEALSNYFIAAQRARRLVQRDFDRAFSLGNILHSPVSTAQSIEASAEEKGESGQGENGVDFIVTPTAPSTPPRLDEVKKQSHVETYATDVFTVPGSLAGLPAASVPVGGGEEGAVGMQVLGQYGDDEGVLDCVELLRSVV